MRDPRHGKSQSSVCSSSLACCLSHSSVLLWLVPVLLCSLSRFSQSPPAVVSHRLFAFRSPFLHSPFTIAFWAVVANQVGNFVLRIDAATVEVSSAKMGSSWWVTIVEVFEMAGVTVVGFLVLAVVSSAVGYLLSGAIWRLMVARRRAKRLKGMEQRLDQRLGAD